MILVRWITDKELINQLSFRRIREYTRLPFLIRKPTRRSGRDTVTKPSWPPSPTEDLLTYKNILLAFARRPDVCTILPLRGIAVFTLSKYQSEFETHVEPLWPSIDTLRAA